MKKINHLKKEKDYFERGVFEKKKNNSISPLHKTLNNYVKKDSKGSKEKDSLLAKNTTNVNNTNNTIWLFDNKIKKRLFY